MAFTKLMYHVVFSTKELRPFSAPGIAPRLYQYVGGIIRGDSGQLLAAGGMPDHLHLAVIMDARTAIADLVRDVKSNSSRWVHREFSMLGDFRWQDGYGAFSVSASVMPEVVRYVEGQESHHRRLSFQEEFVALLGKHEIPYDPRYIWA